MFEPQIQSKAFITDTEAGEGTLHKSIALALSNNCSTFIFGGDICDKGPDSIKDVHRVLQPDFDLRIAGNRDLNKPRLFEIFSRPYVENFGTAEFDRPPFWAPSDANKPSTFIENLTPAYITRSHEDKQVIVAQWILEKTMNAPEAFAFKQYELSKLLDIPTAALDEKIVLRFFIEELLPLNMHHALLEAGLLPGQAILPDNYDTQTQAYKGQMYGYLKRARLLYLDHANFYAHSIFHHAQIGTLLSGDLISNTQQHNRPAVYFRQWIAAINQEYQKNLDGYYREALSSLVTHQTNTLVDEHGIKGLPLVMTGLPQHTRHNPHALVSSNYPSRVLENTNNLTATLTPLAQQLNICGVEACFTGHNPQVQTMPVFRRIEGVSFVFGDTGRPPHHTSVPACAIHNTSTSQHLITINEQYVADTQPFPYLGQEITLDDKQVYLINAVSLSEDKNSGLEDAYYVLIQQAVVPPGFITDPLHAEPVKIPVHVIDAMLQSKHKRKRDEDNEDKNDMLLKSDIV
jgi:hypothetical protein